MITSSGPSFAPNDACEDAALLTINDPPVAGTTVPATEDFSMFDCGLDIESPGVWYSVIGTGERLRASTCFGTDFDTKLHVYRGACDVLACEAANDDSEVNELFCGFKSSVEWDSFPNVEYHILISGFDGSTGRYGIDVISIS